ncbi:hypothetical protein AB0I72_16980 [Nocardiopsis sp. NPDC049922]|uniref:hypothetical protein n=1 Tax=Nocardiopsis sp. NPDC049922 TaxID=3155157 RepID=UPI0033D223E3
MRIIVTGGRDYTDAATVARALAHYAPTGPHVLVHGACKTVREDGTPYELATRDGRPEPPGVDRLAHHIAFAYGWTVEPHPARWTEHGRAAGPIRNKHMARLGADGCIAFPGGAGTRDMIASARAAGIPVWEPVRGT